jgi:hypothetical protein
LVVEMLTHAGLSILLSAKHTMVTSLGSKSNLLLQALTRTGLIHFAYNNFDMDFKSHILIAGQPSVTLKHATSALALLLNHGVEP